MVIDEGIDVRDVEAAAARLCGWARRPALLEFPLLNEATGGRILIKPEIFQIAGSFKFRGAYNRLVQIPLDERGRGAVAWSSGNHAQGVAAAAALLAIPATIVMPEDAPKIKVERTRAYGAEIVFCDRFNDDREAIGRRLAAERQAALVPSYDDYDVIAGQGTIGLEIAADVAALGLTLDHVLAPCSGGSLIAGIATAVKAHAPAAAVYTVEPAGFDDTARSLAAGERLRNGNGRSSLCDALLAPLPGTLTFPINRRLLAGGLVVSEDEIKAAMRFAFRELKLVVEPGGAAALAAVLAGKLPLAGRTTAIVLSGGNVDPEVFAAIIAG